MSETKDLNKNPLLKKDGLPAFHLISPAHVVPAVEYVTKEISEDIENLEQRLEPDCEGLLKPLEGLFLPLEFSWNPVVHLLAVKNSNDLRKAHEAVLGQIVALGLRLLQSPSIYQALRQIRNKGSWRSLSEPQKRVIEKRTRNARLAGAGLKGRAKERFAEIEKELSEIGTRFSNNVLDATKAFEMIITEAEDVRGWPENLKQLAAQSYHRVHGDMQRKMSPDTGPWRITLDFPSYLPFMRHSRRRDQRENLYRAFITRASQGNLDNEKLIHRTLLLR